MLIYNTVILILFLWYYKNRILEYFRYNIISIYNIVILILFLRYHKKQSDQIFTMRFTVEKLKIPATIETLQYHLKKKREDP